MTDHVDVPIVATGDWIDAAWINQYIGDNVRAWRQAYTAAGMMAYAVDSNTLSGLAAPAGLSLLQHDGAVPSWFVKGAAYKPMRVNEAGNAFEFRNNLVTLLKGSGDQTVLAGNPILWSTELFDDGGWHSTSVNTSRITVTSTGRYVVSGIIGLWTPGGGTTDAYSLAVHINGVAFLLIRQPVYEDGTMQTAVIPNLAVFMNAGNYAEIYYSGGGIINMDWSYFSLERVG